LIPGLYTDAIDGDDENGGHEDAVDGTLRFDVFNLAVFNHHPLKDSNESTIKESTVHATQLLVNRIFSLPVDVTDEGPVAQLPDERALKNHLPRAKKVPEPKTQTKWEKFASEKGITKKKRDRMVWDEEREQYLPRYGYKRKAEGIEEYPVVEIKNGQDPYADPFEAKAKEKKERVQKNLKQQLGNQIRAGKVKKGKAKIEDYDPGNVPGIPTELIGEGKKRGKVGVRSALELVQKSTASMGRFDEVRSGEPMMKQRGLKRAFKDNTGLGSADKDNMKAQLRQVADKVDKKARGVTNSLKPYEGIIPDAPTDGFKKTKGKGKTKTEEAPKKKLKKK